MSTRIYLQSSFILHRRPYRETSMLLDILTEKLGRLTLLAKGVKRKKNRHLGLLEPFNNLRISWIQKGSLPIFTDVENIATTNYLVGKYLYSAFYLNELVLKLVPKEEHDSAIYTLYSDAINCLVLNSNVENTLRIFEKNLLSTLGYAVDLNRSENDSTEIDPALYYKFSPESGFHMVASVSNNHQQFDVFSGEEIIAIRDEHFSDLRYLNAAKRLYRIAIKSHLEGRRINTRSLFTPCFKGV